MLPRLFLATGRTVQLLNATRVLVGASRSCGWTRDWKPGPIPVTDEEKAAAARKYNLIPEDYESYPAEEGWGDYPKLPPVSQDARDPYDDFDYHYRRRNYGEMLHVDYDIMTSEKGDPYNAKLRYSPFVMWGSFLGFIASFVLLTSIFEYYDLRICQPMKPKQYPGPGKKHYTFEPDLH